MVRIRRKRRGISRKKRQTETAYAVTDLCAEQAIAKETAAWARGHRIIESTVHRTKDVTFGEDAGQVCCPRIPVVMSAQRDLARATLHRAGWAGIACGRRAHAQPETVLALHGIP
ncbi:hypothetical protein AB0903_07280 [Streptomyces sp. NPDC048389]|uniref:hypothetical protein n=1 Tax=Streptomyces sp. NPDC048389 TaxID=3154622 RepID=UPI0034521840